MRQNLTRAAFVLLLGGILYTGCKKGDTGPAGAQGPKGTANVQYSNWLPLSMHFSTADSLFEQTIKADSLTQGIIDSGLVLTYLKYTDPNTNETTLVNAENYLQETFTPGNIELFAGFDFSGINFRYMLIPGGLKVGRLSGNPHLSRDIRKTITYEEALQMTGQK
jgi:hypothetical protein